MHNEQNRISALLPTWRQRVEPSEQIAKLSLQRYFAFSSWCICGCDEGTKSKRHILMSKSATGKVIKLDVAYVNELIGF